MAALPCDPASVPNLAKELCSQNTQGFYHPAGKITKVGFLGDPLRAYASKQPERWLDVAGLCWGLQWPHMARKW